MSFIMYPVFGRFRVFALALSLNFGLSISAWANTTPEWKNLPAKDLVQLLGDDDFQKREQAFKVILESRDDAIDELQAGLNHADPEIRERCRRLIPLVASRSMNRRVEEFLKNPESPESLKMPGWKTVQAIVGSGQAEREFYARMVRRNPRLLSHVDSVNKEEAFQALCSRNIELSSLISPGNSNAIFLNNGVVINNGVVLQNNSGVSQSGKKVPAVDIAAVFLLSADAEIIKLQSQRPNNNAIVLGTGNRNQMTLQYLFAYGNNVLKEAMEDAKDGPGVKKLFTYWIQQNLGSKSASNPAQAAIIPFTNPALYSAINYIGTQGLKDFQPILLQVTESKNLPPMVRGQALLHMAKVGTNEDIQRLKPLLEDQSELIRFAMPNRVNNNNNDQGMLEVQMRDVALGAAILLRGLKPREFGFDGFDRFGYSGDNYNVYMFGFTSNLKRANAFTQFLKDYERDSLPLLPMPKLVGGANGK